MARRKPRLEENGLDREEEEQVRTALGSAECNAAFGRVCASGAAAAAHHNVVCARGPPDSRRRAPAGQPLCWTAPARGGFVALHKSAVQLGRALSDGGPGCADSRSDGLACEGGLELGDPRAGAGDAASHADSFGVEGSAGA